MERMEKHKKINVKALVTWKCMFVIETESWCVGLFNLKLALFIASIESEMSAIRKQSIGTTLPVKQFITGI